ncbi:acetate--CoA ligase family protein [Roseibium sp. MMSF_3412]|uniref:acetate--CoA ligase family protein n=1 Tax=Roseibium sp. MMSF_3412 TaxID=3046712 RepID=UPI00273ED356|nr:acetate--CoA ligase family protein [Roseibium sp. MMSF_3412]
MKGLESLLRPKSVAVVGGGFWCANVVDECRKLGFEGDICVVHPTRSEMGGCPVVRSIDDLPFVPDATFVGVNRHATIEIVRALSKMGAGGAVCFASGFREAAAELADGDTLQDALIEAAGEMPFLGPNCYGFINALDGAALWPDQHGLISAQSGVAILTQSSNIALNLTMQARGLPIAYLVTVGNQAQKGLSALADALLEDERVTAIGLHIEGLDDLSEFSDFARRAHAAGKPVVALKIGRSEQARAATISHTASLAGSSAGASALFAKLGLVEVKSLAVFLETLKLVHAAGMLPDNKIVSMSCSGGEASLVADSAIDLPVSFPALNSAQTQMLQDLLGPKVALANPLDYHTYIWGDTEAMSAVFAAMMEGDASFGIVVLDFPRNDRCNADEWLKVIDAVAAAKAKSGKPMGIVSSLPETMPEDVAARLLARGIVPMVDLNDTMAAVAAVSQAGRTEKTLAVHVPDAPKGAVEIGESRSKNILQEHGLRVPESGSANGLEGVVAVAEEIGFPVVLKGTGIAHKSEAGAVALRLTNSDQVLAAASKMPSDTFLVEEMVCDVVAELLVGVVRDQAHGYVLTLAAGGVLTELLQDSVSLILPVAREDVDEALGKLRIARLLDGYRGQPACDRGAIVDAVMAVQSYALSVPVNEVEINPLLCGTNFAIAADALIKGEETSDG